jgi:hypothetical protein
MTATAPTSRPVSSFLCDNGISIANVYGIRLVLSNPHGPAELKYGCQASTISTHPPSSHCSFSLHSLSPNNFSPILLRQFGGLLSFYSLFYLHLASQADHVDRASNYPSRLDGSHSFLLILPVQLFVVRPASCPPPNTHIFKMRFTQVACATVLAAAVYANPSPANAAAAADSTTLAANAIQSGSFNDGQLETGAEAGQAASAVSQNNFMNVCGGKTLTNGLQFTTGSCNGIRKRQTLLAMASIC